MREDTRTIVFAAIICVSCSLLLSVTAATLRTRQDANVAYNIKQNIVKAFGIDISTKDRRQIMDIAQNKIRESVIDAETGKEIEGLKIDEISDEALKNKTKLPLYAWIEDGEVTKYAFPISGKGLWSMLYGYMALNQDMETVAGITFYKHGETPGLGAEIEKEWFQRQFPGKKLYEEGAPVNFSVVKGSIKNLSAEKQDISVDGISGATLTSKGVQALINSDAALYSPYFNQLKGN